MCLSKKFKLDLQLIIRVIVSLCKEANSDCDISEIVTISNKKYIIILKEIK